VKKNNQEKTLSNIISDLEEHKFKLVENKFMGGDTITTSQGYTRITHPKFKKMSIGYCKPEIYFKYKFFGESRFYVGFSLKVDGFNTFIPFLDKDFQLVIPHHSFNEKHFMNNFPDFANNIGKLEDFVSRCEEKRLSLADKSRLLELMVNNRFNNILINPRYTFKYDSFDYDQFSTPINGLDLDVDTWWGFFITVYINLFDEKKYVNTEMPIVKRGNQSDITTHKVVPITYIRKIVTISSKTVADFCKEFKSSNSNKKNLFNF
jgi:hypothetical protein